MSFLNKSKGDAPPPPPPPEAMEDVGNPPVASSGPASNMDAAHAALKMTPQEKALYQRHLDNLNGPGGVDNANGSRSTLYQMGVDVDGKTYNIPTVYDGKILKPADAVKRAEKEGWDKFPSYASEDEAESRYSEMHKFMEKDTEDYMSRKKKEATK